jgi:hypothetical protein
MMRSYTVVNSAIRLISMPNLTERQLRKIVIGARNPPAILAAHGSHDRLRLDEIRRSPEPT